MESQIGPIKIARVPKEKKKKCVDQIMEKSEHGRPEDTLKTTCLY